MPILNPEKAYQLPEKKQDGTGIEINHDELTRLIQAAREYLEPAAFEKFQEQMHSKATADSAYAQTLSVRQGLKIIHDHFFHANTAPSDKASIILKLEERSANCPPGFHNGVNAIVEGFYLANSINDLLYRVRRDLVARTANQLTDEVHANNRCFTIAAASGYGIWPLNKEDIYHGGLSTATIQEKLAEVFEFGMRLFPLLQNLDDQLRGQLVNAGYMGASETGYLAEELEKMEEQLSVLFHNHPVANALLNAQACEKALREPYEKERMTAEAQVVAALEAWMIEQFGVLDPHKRLKLNFLITGIGQHLLPKPWVAELPNDYKQELQPIIDQLPKIPADLVEAKTQLIQAKREFDELFFTTDKTNVHWPNICQLLWNGVKDEGYFTFTDEETALIDKLMQPEQNEEQRVMLLEEVARQWSDLDVIAAINLFETINPSFKRALIETRFEHTTNSYAFFKALLASLHDPVLKSLMIKEHHTDYLKKIEKDISILIPVIPWMNHQDMAQFFLQTRRFEGMSLLEYVFKKRQRREEALALIHGLAQCPDTLKSQVFTQTYEDDYNALMLAVLKQPTAVQPILDALAGCNNPELTKQVLTKANNYGENALMLAAIKEPTVVQPILNTLAGCNNPELIQRELTKTDYNHFNALMLAAYYQPSAVQTILDALAACNNPKLTKKVLTKTNRHDENALMLAVRKQPTAVRPILDALAACNDPELTKQVLTQTNDNYNSKHRNNALMIAINHQPTAVQPIIAAMSSYIDLMIHSKHSLADYAKTDEPSLQYVLSVLAKRPLDEQKAFYAAWTISSPLLKQRGLKELHAQQSLQTLINKTQILDPSTPSSSWEHASSQLQDYLTKSPRNHDELSTLYTLIDTLMHDTTLQTQFDSSIPSSRSRFSMFKSHEEDYATTVKQLKQQLCEMAPDLHLEQLDHPSNPIQYR